MGIFESFLYENQLFLVESRGHLLDLETSNVDRFMYMDRYGLIIDLRKLLEVLNLNQWHFGGDSLTTESCGGQAGQLLKK